MIHLSITTSCFLIAIYHLSYNMAIYRNTLNRNPCFVIHIVSQYSCQYIGLFNTETWQMCNIDIHVKFMEPSVREDGKIFHWNYQLCAFKLQIMASHYYSHGRYSILHRNVVLRTLKFINCLWQCRICTHKLLCSAVPCTIFSLVFLLCMCFNWG